MSRGSGALPGTEEHGIPDLGDSPRGEEALLCAFPRSAALAIPSPSQPVGREWLEANGIADTRVSGAHVKLARIGGRLALEDVGSRNGTWLDGQRLSPGERANLADGAIL